MVLYLLSGAAALYFYYTQMKSNAVIPDYDALRPGREADLDLLKAVTKPRQPGVMTNIIQDQSMTGKSQAAIRNPFGPNNSRAYHINAPEVVQKEGYQRDYQRQLHATQVRFQSFNDHLNTFQQNHSPMEGILESIGNSNRI